MPFVKLDCGILNSTLWYDRGARDVFITALLMAEPFELLEPTPQIQVDSLEYTGWTVPAGWYGFVPAAGVGILHRAGIDDAAGVESLRVLGAPELSSRTPDFEGRRLVRIDGGYLVLNFIKYREKDSSAAERQRRWRERQKVKQSNVPSRVTESTLRVISNQAEAEVQAEVQAKVHTHVPPSAALTRALTDGFDAFWSAYPLKKAKAAARRTWAKLAPDRPLTDAIVAAVETQKAWRNWREGFIPYPATWLNQERWNDEPEPARENAKSRTAGNLDAAAQAMALLQTGQPR